MRFDNGAPMGQITDTTHFFGLISFGPICFRVARVMIAQAASGRTRLGVVHMQLLSTLLIYGDNL